MARTFASLRHYNYRIWFFAALIANTGTWMQIIAQDWLVLAELTNDDAFAVGTITALQFAPLLFFMPVAGLLADRYDKRRMLLCTQTLLALLAFGLGTLVLMGNPQVWQVILFALGTGTVAAFDAPPRTVFVSELVPPEDLPNAVGLNSTSFNLARLIGPGVAGLLISAVGSGWVFYINAASFVFTIGALMLIRTSELYTRGLDPDAARGRGRLREGLRYVRSRGDLRVIFVVVGVVGCLTMNFQLTSAAMARSVFDQDAGGYGILGSILAIGSVSGALMAASRRKTPRTRTVVVAAGLCGVASGVNAVMPTYQTYAASLILVGFSSLVLFTSANTVVQISTDPSVRGRVLSLYQVVLMGTTPIGALIVGWICEEISPRWGIGIGSVAAFCMVIWAYMWGRRHWGVTVRYNVHSQPHIEIRSMVERAREV
ncbi:MAG: MFS transporter [Actinomycetaceae bacterium]|nr:MFS transporter [Actinomycetaceae bacterium]